MDDRDDFVRRFLSRPLMYGITSAREFFLALNAIDALIEPRFSDDRSRDWWGRWGPTLFGSGGFSVSDEDLEQIREITDDWFRSRGLGPDDSRFVQPVLRARSRDANRPPDPDVGRPTVEVQIRVEVEPIARCTDCDRTMQTARSGAFWWFRCTSCGGLTWYLDGNVRRDASTALHHPEFRTCMFMMREIPFPPPPDSEFFDPSP